MTDFFYRTEDIGPSEVLNYFVETESDRRIVDQLKGRNPTVLIGSRGVGKSFLMRVAEQELLKDIGNSKILPVYVTFIKSSLLRSNDPDQFRNWMLARICQAVIRSATKQGLLARIPESARILYGSSKTDKLTDGLENIISDYEDSWKNPGASVNASALPSIEAVRYALEDLSTDIGMQRFAILIDEATHIFLPSQQRQFFTLFRDLRSHCITCNAAIYPGVTSFGDTFQPSHDATMVSIERDVLDEDYIRYMREIVEKQADSTLLSKISVNGQNFATLAYAATGNPRLLLKTVFAAPEMTSKKVNEVLRSYYRSDIWSEHSALAEKYIGHKPIIDWGRNFIEDMALPDLKSKNDEYLRNDKNSTAFIWIHRDAPEVIKEALRILCYTGILTELSSGIKATRSEIGVRYMINLGCLFALETAPASSAFEIAKALTPKRMTEFGSNHRTYESLTKAEKDIPKVNEDFDLKQQFEKPCDVLDITEYQKKKLIELGLTTVQKVFEASEDTIKQAPYIGDVRARQMRNAAVASVLEYLSG